MKKVLSFLTVAFVATLVSCGPSAEEKAAMEKAKQDSITAMQKAYDDSVMTVNAAATEKMRQDSMAAANMEKARQDSTAAAAKKKPATKKVTQIKAGQPLPGRPGAVKK